MSVALIVCLAILVLLVAILIFAITDSGWITVGWIILGAFVIIILAGVYSSNPVLTLKETRPLYSVNGQYFHYTGKTGTSLRLYVEGEDGLVTDEFISRWKFVTDGSEPKCEIYDYEYSWLIFHAHEEWYHIYIPE